MDLINFLDIVPKDIISIVGAGGKTSLLFALSKKMCDKNKVLATTTTKIYVPSKNDFSNMVILNEVNNDYESIYKGGKGIYVVGSHINSENKMIGLNKNQLDKLIPYFNYTFIEADGSKGKSLKGWKYNEPIIYENTTKTIGILDIKAIGTKVNETNIHRIDKFIEITKSYMDKELQIKHLVNLILHKEGLFKYSRGEKILLINKVEDEIDFENAANLISILKSLENKNFHKIIFGSILQNKFYKG